MIERPRPRSGYSKKELLKIIEKMDRDRHQDLRKDQNQERDTNKRGAGCSFSV